MVATVRRAIGVRRVGHTGTLDPFATGLLVILVGRATRLAQFLVGQTKRYSGVIRLGITTDSSDRTGKVTDTGGAWSNFSLAQIDDAMAGFVGKQLQRPPAFSAKKVAGERAYSLARKGEPPVMDECEVEIFSFRAIDIDGPNLQFDTMVSAGTYVRAMARDLGALLGCGAHLAELRRVAVGPFDVAGASPPDGITQAHIRSAREAVSHLRSVTVGSEARDSLRHGRTITVPEKLSGHIAVLADDELVAVAEADGSRLKPRVVLAG